MKYRDVHDEYIALLQKESELSASLSHLKNGYISGKNISGKKYYYLQYRLNGKLVSDYIREENLSKVRAELDKRAMVIKEIDEIEARLDKIEVAAALLDSKLCRTLKTIRRCRVMDSMSLSERNKSLSFGNAISALEGIPASNKTEEQLSDWANGEFSFQESFFNTLQSYNLA